MASVNHALLFTRVAVEDSYYPGDSIEAQLSALRNYAAEHGLTVAAEINVVGSTAEQRLSDIASYLRTHPEVRIVVAMNADRLFRTIKHYAMVEKLIEAFGVEIHFVRDKQTLRRSENPQDRLVQSVFALMSRNYIDNLREEILRGQHAKAKVGLYPGRVPFGYLTIEGKIVEHPIHADIVRQIYFRYARACFINTV